MTPLVLLVALQISTAANTGLMDPNHRKLFPDLDSAGAGPLGNLHWGHSSNAFRCGKRCVTGTGETPSTLGMHTEVLIEIKAPPNPDGTVLPDIVCGADESFVAGLHRPLLQQF